MLQLLEYYRTFDTFDAFGCQSLSAFTCWVTSKSANSICVTFEKGVNYSETFR